MAFDISVALANGALDAFEAVIGPSPIIKLRTGAKPANEVAADTGTVVSTINLPADWMNLASGRTKTKLGTWEDAAADATGIVGHFRLYASDGITCHIQGPVVEGTSANAGEMALVNTDINAGQPVTISAFTLSAV